MAPFSEADRVEALATQRNRWEFLLALYRQAKTVKAGRLQNAPAYQLAQEIGVGDHAEVDRIIDYLEDSNLIKLVTMGPGVAITKHGIDEVERALTIPDEETQHFLPINVITVHGDVTGATFQQGTSGTAQATATGTTAPGLNWDGLAELLPAIRAAITDLPEPARAAASADLQSVEAQLKSPTPRIGFVRECLSSLRKILESGAGSLAGRQLAEWLGGQGWLS
jgi:hypothetical protein